MENLVIQGRLKALREVMQAAGIQYYMMPTADFHNSEYVNEYFTVLQALTEPWLFLRLKQVFGLMAAILFRQQMNWKEPL